MSLASVPFGSRTDSALSRNRIISLEDKKGRRGTRSLGLSTPAPMTSESLLRKWIRDVGNWSQRMNRRSSPNRCLMRSWWRTTNATDVFPIPPAPMRATGVRVSARSMIVSISSSRPKQTLGGGGGNSPGGVLCKSQNVVWMVSEIADLA